MKHFNVILATDTFHCIGTNNKLPWEFDLDMKHFSNMTKSSNSNVFGHKNILIMGRRTWESFNCKVLSNRINYVITSQNMEAQPNTLFFKDFYSAYVQASESKGDIWVIGGSKVYDSALRFWACDKIYLTLINGKFSNQSDTNIYFDTTKYPITWTDEIEYNDVNKLDNKEYKLTFKKGHVKHGVEAQYLHTLYDVMTSGQERETRNGITCSKFGKTISWDLEDGFPLLTTKKVFWKGIVEELLFFIRGDTDTTKLSAKGVKIWEANTTREFLDKTGLTSYPVGDMGPMYGYQWRKFNGSDVDQLKKIINEIKTDPHSRRILMTDFNPLQAHLGVLYPCHSIILQFYVENQRLSCSMYQRSSDNMCGTPFNIASTSLLVHIIAQLTNLKAGKVNLIMGDYHIYKVHYEQVLTQLSRTPYNLPKLVIKQFETLEQVEESVFEDYKIVDYQSHPAIKAQMVA
jgi:dihydrofolate reductase/thymidylate synthase